MVLRDTSIKTKLYSNGLCLRKFTRMQSGRPEPNAQHFFEKPVEDTLVGVVVPIYNEEAIDLRKTLLALDMQVNYMKAQKMNIVPHVMLVQDGVSKAHPSMKKYLRNMFNLDEDQWNREFETEDTSAPYQTFILQMLNNSRVSYVNVNAGYKANNPVNMLVTLIIKKDNRKKHNSHEWFLGESGFVNYYRPKYSFCTDCSTLFHKACLMKLVQYMESHPNCGVCTGRQRVMTKEMQGDPNESAFSLASMLRHAQRFDYESSFVCYTGTFSAVGFLPVVPGPCGLYRTNTLIPDKDHGGYTGSPCEWYFDVVNTDPDQSGLVLGNLRIAEDRVLSYAVVLKASCPSTMGLVPQAVFYFEAETSLKRLMLQRRRWINGTWAGYWYLGVQHPDLIFKCSQISLFTKIFVWFLLLCQLATYFIVALAPAIFLGALRLSLNNMSVDTDGVLAIAAWSVLVALYLYFVYYHHTEVYLGYLFNIWLLFSAILSASSITSFIIYVAQNHHLLHYKNLAKGDFDNDDFTASLTIYIVIGMLVLPLIIAIIADGSKSFLLMLRSIVPYYMLLPMVVGFFSAYSFSRCWDLTWGNRPSEADPAHQHNAKQKVEELKTQSATLAAFIAIANIFFFFLQEVILAHNAGKLYIAFGIFATAIIQMTIGLVWFTLWRIKYLLHYIAFFAIHCRGMKKFTYSTYGNEVDDSSVDSSDVYTLYYDDNNDSDVDDVADFIDDGDAVDDYYDPDSQAIVLVDGDIQRHMSVTNLTISYPTLSPIPEGKVLEDGAAPTGSASASATATPVTSPKPVFTSALKNSNMAGPSSAATSPRPHFNFPANVPLPTSPTLRSSSSGIHSSTSSGMRPPSLTSSAIRHPSSFKGPAGIRSPQLSRSERTALANQIISPNRVPIIASPAMRPPNFAQGENETDESQRSLNHSHNLSSHTIIARRSSLVPARGTVSSPVVSNPRLSYSYNPSATNTSSSNVSFANPPATVISIDQESPKSQ